MSAAVSALKLAQHPSLVLLPASLVELAALLLTRGALVDCRRLAGLRAGGARPKVSLTSSTLGLDRKLGVGCQVARVCVKVRRTRQNSGTSTRRVCTATSTFSAVRACMREKDEKGYAPDGCRAAASSWRAVVAQTYFWDRRSQWTLRGRHVLPRSRLGADASHSSPTRRRSWIEWPQPSGHRVLPSVTETAGREGRACRPPAPVSKHRQSLSESVAGAARVPRWTLASKAGPLAASVRFSQPGASQLLI